MTLTLPSPPDIKLFEEQVDLKDATSNIHNDASKRPLTPPLPSSPSSNTLKTTKTMPWEIIHDNSFCMFKIVLDSVGSTAALCYLPTRFQGIIEFYHLEIPIAYRHQGLGDYLLDEAFQWVERSKISVVPSCPFVHEYLETRFPDKKSGGWKYIVNTQERKR
ncbi:hypothetical protein K501DRAFT_320736 [Backusella circina FSU 941]|nr:hypothetical protein K501DRAFT_320736 [Backusella circina FSU 941]